jgi:hypothetical protein
MASAHVPGVVSVAQPSASVAQTLADVAVKGSDPASGPLLCCSVPPRACSPVQHACSASAAVGWVPLALCLTRYGLVAVVIFAHAGFISLATSTSPCPPIEPLTTRCNPLNDAASPATYSYTLSRIDVRLGEQSDADADRHDKLSTLVVNQNESLKAYITQQLAITAASMTGDMAPRLPKLHPNVKKARARRAAAAAAASAKYQALEPAAKKELDTVLVSVQSRRRFCPRACPCACHDTRRSNTPDVLGRVLGQLFVGYSGIPFVTPKCDHKSCSQNTAPKVQAEYWFPAHVFWSKIFRVEATYHAATGPSLQIRSFRHVPDSSPAVNYTINGNIDGLKTLFSQGMASPNDVSNTRGYSLLRVSY